VGEQLSTDAEIGAELVDSKSSGFFGRFGGYPLVRDFKARALHQSGGIMPYVRSHVSRNYYPFVYFAKMKIELVPLLKLLKRKQRMFMIQCKEHVAAHKYFFSKQSKRLRKHREIAHGQTWFYGHVHRMALGLIGSPVDSEDDEFWDKSFRFMTDIYRLRRRALDMSVKLTESDALLCDLVIKNMINVILVLPSGDIVSIDCCNPSGADATTENNCFARVMVEVMMQVMYYKHIDRAPDPLAVVNFKKNTKYLGDDRIAAGKDYPDGYLDYYRDNVKMVGVQLKTLVRTDGPVGAEFAGFTIARSFWNKEYYVPHYKLDKIWVGLFVDREFDHDIILSRFMAFSLLMYPNYEEYSRIKPLAVSYLQKFETISPLLETAISFWSDEDYLRRCWTGLEGTDGGGILCLECPMANSLLLESLAGLSQS